MKEDKWQHFCMTGSIRDYLQYCADVDTELCERMQQHGYMDEQKEEATGNAGICRSDRVGY